MVFVLFHIGDKIPDHFKYCIKQIQYTNPNALIHIITNLNIQTYDNINIINIKDLQIPNIGDYYLHDPMGPLFRNAMLRLFYIESFLKKYNIEDVIHFDNDVLIYDNVNIIENELRKHNFLITATNSSNYIFGFSYIKNSNSLFEINKKLYDLIIQGEHELEKLVGSMPHEMRLLNYINQNKKYIEVLPITPNDLNFDSYKYCFDPSSYGQYLGGMPPEKDKYIGEKIIQNKIKVLFENKKPYIIMNNNRYNIFNLHIHNKQLEKFI